MITWKRDTSSQPKPWDVFDCYAADFRPVFTTRHQWLAHAVAVVLGWFGGCYDYDNLGPSAQPAWLNPGERIGQ